MCKDSGWNLYLTKNKWSYQLQPRVDASSSLGSCVLSFRGKPLNNKRISKSLDMFWYDFEELYAIGIYSRYLWGWYFNSRLILWQLSWRVPSEQLRSKLYWNVDNLIDVISSKFMGIDGSGIGMDCGFLRDFRQSNDFALEEKYNVLWYLFVTESCFAAFYTKEFHDSVWLFNKHSIFGNLEFDYNFPFMYGFVLKDKELSIHDCVSDLVCRNFYPQVILDKYITNLAEAEVFMFFLRIIACICAGSIWRMFFGGKKWYEGEFPKTGFSFVRLDGGCERVGQLRAKMFDFLVNIYKHILEDSVSWRLVGLKGVGWRWKAKMSIRVIFWLGLVKLWDIYCFGWVSSDGLMGRCKAWLSGLVFKMIPLAWVRSFP